MWRTHKCTCGYRATIVFLTSEMEPRWEPTCGLEEHGYAFVRAHSQEDGEGTPAPPPLKVRKERKMNKGNVFVSSLPSNVGPGNTVKGALLGLGGGVHYFL